MTRSRYLVAIACGLALLALHAAGFPLLLDRFHRPTLTVDLGAPATTSSLDTSAIVPDELSGRVTMRIDGTGGGDLASGPPGDEPGLHQISWSVDYRGGFRDQVDASQLVGPFQDPSSPPCALWIVVGQRFLAPGTGATGAGTLAALLEQTIEHEMVGFEQWPIGEFLAAEQVDMQWLAFDDIHRASRRRTIIRRAKDPPPGVLQVTVTLRFEDGEVPLWFVLIPQIEDDAIRLRTHVEAELELDNRVYQWVSDLFEGDELVSEIASDQVDHALVDAFGLPPPVALGGGQELRFGYCRDQPIQVVTNSHAAIPLRLLPLPGNPGSAGPNVRPGEAPDPPAIRPVQLGSPAGIQQILGGTDRFAAPLAVIFELDAINGVLHQLWTSGFLDRQLIAADLVERFNGDPVVQQLLSVRLSRPRLSLPPTLVPASSSEVADGAGLPEFDLGLEVALELHDRGAVMPARLLGSVGFGFGNRAPAGLVARLQLDELTLTCRPRRDQLVPCYSNLVAAFRDRADDVHGALSRRFTALFEDIALQRTIELQTARFRIEQASVFTHRQAASGAVRVDLFGTLASTLAE